MILEHAILTVRTGEEAAFEAAMHQAVPLISATSGFVDFKLYPCLERKGRYLMLVQWQKLENHTQGFRGSSRYVHWKALLHHFYDPFPLVEHYDETIIEIEKDGSK